MGEWKTKCGRCKKMLIVSEFNDVDYGYGVYHKSTWCKACDKWMDKKRWESNKKWLELNKTYGNKPKMIEFVQTEEYKKEELKKLAYPFGWPHK